MPLSCQKFPSTAHALKLRVSIYLWMLPSAMAFRAAGGQLESWSLVAIWKPAPLPPGSHRPGPAPGGSLFTRRQREPRLSRAEAALAGRNLTILIYQIDKILSLQLRGYVINCVLITAAATSSECSNLRRNRGRCFKFLCVNSTSTNRAVCVTPGGAMLCPGDYGLGLLAAGLPGWGDLWKSLKQTESCYEPIAQGFSSILLHLGLPSRRAGHCLVLQRLAEHRNLFKELLTLDSWPL